MEIHSGQAPRLSNFSPRPFVFRGVECASMEGLLQSLKGFSPEMQVHVCTLVGRKAKRKGSKKNRRWKSRQQLWWMGEPMCRHSQEYQNFLDEAFNALAENTAFQRVLLGTGNAVLKHSIGKNKRKDTVLTTAEFISRLHRIRSRL